MEDQKKAIEEGVDPVSRKTNEEIDADEEGNLIIGGKKVGLSKSVATAGPFSEDIPKGKDSLNSEGQD